MLMPHLNEVYDAAKYWLPVITVITLIVRAYRNAKHGITEWANQLFNNHLTHIQIATESTAASLKEMVTYQKASAESVKKVAEDLELHEKQDLEIQGKILTGIEVIKEIAKIN
jgi:hypothetical protein